MRLRKILPTAAAVVFSGILALPVACKSSNEAKPEKLCTPGNYVFCRCRDRQEGTKLCKEDSKSFGPCEPCETADNPELPEEEDPDPRPDEPPPRDGGTDQQSPTVKCGDGVAQEGEDCDDKNTDETDGCNKDCKLAGTAPLKSISCPGIEVHVWGGAHKPTLAATTVGGGTHESSGANVCGSAFNNPNPTSGAAATDRVFKVIAHKTGTMNVVTTDTNYNNYLSVAETCTDGDNKLLACTNQNAGVGGETLTFPVDSGKTYYVFVDGAGISENKGNFRVTFSIP
jgi:cysteine-rich repeat protein